MPDVSIIGSGPAARACDDLLGRTGFEVRRAFEVDETERNPAIVGETAGAYAIARQLIGAGRHVLIASPLSLSASQLLALLAARSPKQALFLWSERRFHPGYRFIGGLAEADPVTWQPRFIRQTSLLIEAASAIAIRWRTLESIALSLKLTQAAPESVIAAAAESEQRNAPDFLSLNLQTDKGPAFIQVGMGESSARQETTLAVAYRKAYIDELNESVPIRITDGSETAVAGSSRWVSCPSPAPEELTRQQCLAFLEATERATLAEAEAALWARSLAVLHAADASLSEDGAAVDVQDQDQPGFRVILGQQPRQRSAGRMLPA